MDKALFLAVKKYILKLKFFIASSIKRRQNDMWHRLLNLQDLRTKIFSKGIYSIADIKDVTSKLGSCGCVSDLSDGQLSQC